MSNSGGRQFPRWSISNHASERPLEVHRRQQMGNKTIYENGGVVVTPSRSLNLRHF